MSANVPCFKDGGLLFCNGGLAASCCFGKPIGWIVEDGYRIQPDDPDLPFWGIYCACLVNNCEMVGKGGTISGTLNPGDLFVAEYGLIPTYYDAGDYTYVLRQLLGPYNSREEAVGVLTDHYETIRNYARYCLCTNDCHGEEVEGEFPSVAPVTHGFSYCEWWDYESGQDYLGCDSGYMLVLGFWTNNGHGDRASIHLEKYIGGEWIEIGEADEGAIENHLLKPCEYLRFAGGVNMDLYQDGDVYGRLEGVRIGHVDADNCTDELRAAFDLVPPFSQGGFS